MRVVIDASWPGSQNIPPGYEPVLPTLEIYPDRGPYVSLDGSETAQLYRCLQPFFAKPQITVTANLESVEEVPHDETLGDRRKKIEQELNRFCSELTDAINEIEQPTIRALLKFLLDMVMRP